jgi:hypothetical protein
VNQGDQIGRISAQWAIAYFGSFYQKLQKNPKFWASFSKYQCINVDKKCFGLHFGRVFFTNSSGHPGRDAI